MLTDDTIRAALNNTLETTDCPELGACIHGKVRDSYKLEGKRILVTSDRISAFDRVLGTIPFKGQVLNQLAAFWFEKTKDIIPNHIISMPDPNIVVVKECEQLPLEFVVRGYITGVTMTSAWTNYKNGVRNFCGNILPEGLRKDQKFDEPIITPTTKHEKHDRNVSREEAIDEGLIDGETFDAAADICRRLYDFGVQHAASRGLIFVDTKYEIGRYDGALTISDEINTPDSSRYWYADTYQELFDAGEEQRKLDKEYVRTWLAAQGFVGEGDIPVITDEIRVEAAKRYIKAYELITGEEFVVSDEPVQERVAAALVALA
ncbi:MAG: phosphoribosylaminoimidazolesuccinocarboxamide synthase [Kiritimatiellae bacterium]|nr:phosphoribosylaminoimidazolesuccinocarboxamide synthase [Kiritimatiellia bacterium]